MDYIHKLCELLKERGVDFEVHGIPGNTAITWRGEVCSWIALGDEKGLGLAVYRDYLTPEQTIKVSLGGADGKDDE